MTRQEYIDRLENLFENVRLGVEPFIGPVEILTAAKSFVTLLESNEWVIVPIEPTEKMIIHGSTTDFVEASYDRMIAAAPQFPIGDET